MRSELADDHDVQILSVDGSTWNLVEPLARKLEPKMLGSYTAEEMRIAMEDEQLAIWAAVVDGEIWGLILLTVYEYPSGRRGLNIQGISGRDVAVWYDAGMEMVMRFYDRLGATRLYSVSRPGMVPFMRERGWKSTRYVVMEYPHGRG